MFCLAGVGGHLGGFVQSARDVPDMVAIDGCEIGCARAIGLSVQEQSIDMEMLRGADEVLMSGTTIEVLAITSIDNHPVGTGRVGPLAQRLHQEFATRARGKTAPNTYDATPGTPEG